MTLSCGAPLKADVNVTVRQLNPCWKLIRNPGSVENSTKPKEYLEDLVHCGGLNPSVWKRGQILRQPSPISSAESLISCFEQPVQLSPVGDLNCVWSAGTTSCTSLTYSSQESLESSLKLVSKTEIMKELTMEPVIEGSTAEKGDNEIQPINIEIQQVQEIELACAETVEVQMNEPREVNWTALFIFLAILLLHRLLMTPADGSCAVS